MNLKSEPNLFEDRIATHYDALAIRSVFGLLRLYKVWSSKRGYMNLESEPSLLKDRIARHALAIDYDLWFTKATDPYRSMTKAVQTLISPVSEFTWAMTVSKRLSLLTLWCFSYAISGLRQTDTHTHTYTHARTRHTPARTHHTHARTHTHNTHTHTPRTHARARPHTLTLHTHTHTHAHTHNWNGDSSAQLSVDWTDTNQEDQSCTTYHPCQYVLCVRIYEYIVQCIIWGHWFHPTVMGFVWSHK